MRTTALIVAAGNSIRFGGDTPKQFVTVAGAPLLAWTIVRFEMAERIDDIVLVVAEDRVEQVRASIGEGQRPTKVVKAVVGGATRQQSVLNGLENLPETTELVAIHDGARPLISPQDIDAVVKAAESSRAAILASKVSDTVKKASSGIVSATVDRGDLWQAQTPQVFEREVILAAHRRAARDGIKVTDDSSLLESEGHKVGLVEATSMNLKVTTPDDIRIVEALLAGVGEE